MSQAEPIPQPLPVPLPVEPVCPELVQVEAPEDCLDSDGVLDVDGVDVSDGFNLVVGASEVPPEFAPSGSLSKWMTLKI